MTINQTETTTHDANTSFEDEDDVDQLNNPFNEPSNSDKAFALYDFNGTNKK